MITLETIHTPHWCPPPLHKALYAFLTPGGSWMWFISRPPGQHFFVCLEFIWNHPSANGLDFELAIDYLCKCLVVLGDVYLPLTGLLLLLFGGQHHCHHPPSLPLGPLYMGRITHVTTLWLRFSLFHFHMGWGCGDGGQGLGFCFPFNFWIPWSFYSGLSYCCSCMDGEKRFQKSRMMWIRAERILFL